MDLIAFQEKIKAAFERAGQRLSQYSSVKRVRNIIIRSYHELGVRQIILLTGYMISAMFSLLVMLSQTLFPAPSNIKPNPNKESK